MKKPIIILFVLFVSYQYINTLPSNTNQPTVTPIASHVPTEHKTEQSTSTQRSAIDKAVQNRRSHVQVEGSGRVIKVLRDDTKGSRHQKFLLRIASGKTILIAHNIDLAPRINGIRKGDTVKFYGQYEWNAKGGVVHWTHKDPRGRHKSGWLKHQGRVYQ